MRDISARELKEHNILAVERFQDNTSRMIEFSVLRSCAYGSPGDEMRLFLTEDGYQAALLSQQRREIKIKRYARVIEGHILDFKPDKLADTEPTTLLRVSPTEIQKLRIRGSAERVKHLTLPLKKSAKLIDCMTWPAYRGQMPSNR